MWKWRIVLIYRRKEEKLATHSIEFVSISDMKCKQIKHITNHKPSQAKLIQALIQRLKKYGNGSSFIFFLFPLRLLFFFLFVSLFDLFMDLFYFYEMHYGRCATKTNAVLWIVNHCQYFYIHSFIDEKEVNSRKFSKSTTFERSVFGSK